MVDASCRRTATSGTQRGHCFNGDLYRIQAAPGSSWQLQSSPGPSLPSGPPGSPRSDPLAVSVMSPVEPHRIAGQKPAHDRCDRSGSSAQKQMHVIGHQRPCVTGRSHLPQKTGQSLKKILSVFFILENPFPFDSSDNNMMQGTRGVNAGLAWHALQILGSCSLVNKETTSPFFPTM